MGTNTDRDFASLLDDLFVARAMAEDSPPKPSIPFDYLAVADELYSGRIKVAAEAVASEYREASENFEAGFAALLASLDELVVERVEPQEDLPSVDPEAIARELNLTAVKASADFSRLRRTFAFHNHPDRVAPHLRQRAMVRMQVANMLIDDAKRRAAKASKR
ncbi:hypothetical protein [Pseudaminobacter soli (ex Li et al. 2025)]|uniref:Uncharacterized protein n=1 Tax=Pseudaminobacter soli (ex Li et al. 2025) TaxID=1295366 RepID=A0A2P7SBU5_9HYPH|nr:hypothetical protein [Mesorhizobium soli]PSJ59948.1 hypothetical protein C7I85_15170 [Mesorhizobium soli]